MKRSRPIPPRRALLASLLALGLAGTAPARVAEVDGASIDPIHETITLDVQDADLVQLLRLVADASDLNVIIDPAIRHTVTMKLENVSWKQFLDLTLRMYELGSLRQGNVLLIAPSDHPAFRAAEAPRAAGRLETRTLQLNYADADDVAAILRNVVLSPDGTVAVDRRTNTLILRDYEPNLREAIRLVGHP